MRVRTLAAVSLVSLLAASAPLAQETIDRDIYWKIRREATDNSHIMRTLQVLTDLYGPRLTGSPNLKGASDWVVKETTAWGLKNAHLEPWDFGHPGWLNEKLSVHVVSPVKDALVVEALAWTPGTNGAVTAPVVTLELPQRPTKERLAQFFDEQRAKVKGRIVMAGPPQVLEVTIVPPAKRREDNDVKAQFSGASTPGGPPGPPQAAQPKPDPNVVPANQVAEQVDQFLVEAGAVGRVNDAGRDHGQIRAFNNRTFDVAKAVPTVVMRNEDFGRLWRLSAAGQTVELEMNIVNRTYPEGATQYNVVAEIPGTDKAQEVVMLGGHLDSWHSATGATDNAIGCATMLEAIRILNAIGVKPRRTIRVALWSGEEQGLLGSQAYVKEHFGSFENPKPEYANFGGYFNIDSGTGRARGMTVFGPPEDARILREATAPFADNGFLGATSTTSRRRGGSDHTSFNEAGLPGIGVSQDPIEYGTDTWHTNLDTYERIIEDDARQSAMVIAAAVYDLAKRDALLPRLQKDTMPAPPTP
ncbi:MAG: M20/M25/M40 family metallo-hydrolase [Acidobacteria bacterium]|nr:M20/M25/M40 family metallo-hydrolase [Acidobacteriota bacterium]